MENYKFTIDSGNTGVRLDKYLVACLPKTLSRTQIQALIAGDKVLVNGCAKKSHYKTELGDYIEVEIAKPRKLNIAAENIPLNVIYEDERLMVVNKPAGLVVHPAPGNYTGTLVNALLHHTNNLSPSSLGRPGIVHRLDKDTSGIMLIAKDEQAHVFLARQFNKRTTDKKYMAVVEGVVEIDNGIVDHPIGRHPRDRKKMAVRFTESKPSVTRYKVLERYKNNTLLELKLETGRTHQIRVHMAYIGHPIVGDYTYGSRRKCEHINRQALHASEISFTHPGTKEVKHFRAPLPEDVKNLIEKLRSN